jgi:hypothetical protein
MVRSSVSRSIALVLSLLAAGSGAVATHPQATHALAYDTENLRAETVTQTTITIRWDGHPSGLRGF